MAITYVGGVTSESSSATGTTPTLDAGWQADDFVLAHCGRDDDGGQEAWTASAGWTEYGPGWGRIDGRDRVTAIFYRKLTGSEGNPTFSTNANALPLSVTLSCFRGVNPTIPFDLAYNVAHLSAGANDPTPTNAAITTVTDGAMVVLTDFQTHDDITTAIAPSGYTIGEHLEGSAYDWRQQAIAYKLVATAGTETPGAWQHAWATNDPEYTCITLALRPAGGSAYLITGAVTTTFGVAADLTYAGSGTVNANSADGISLGDGIGDVAIVSGIPADGLTFGDTAPSVTVIDNYANLPVSPDGMVLGDSVFVVVTNVENPVGTEQPSSGQGGTAGADLPFFIDGPRPTSKQGTGLVDHIIPSSIQGRGPGSAVRQSDNAPSKQGQSADSDYK